jgi:heat shock protein HspQ
MDAESRPMASGPRFTIGQVVHHKLFDYRGVVVDIDATFSLSEEWYEQVARSRPPKDAPWYRVLVGGAAHETYVAERNLEEDDSGAPVEHPLLPAFFDAFENGHYVRSRSLN